MTTAKKTTASKKKTTDEVILADEQLLHPLAQNAQSKKRLEKSLKHRLERFIELSPEINQTPALLNWMQEANLSAMVQWLKEHRASIPSEFLDALDNIAQKQFNVNGTSLMVQSEWKYPIPTNGPTAEHQISFELPGQAFVGLAFIGDEKPIYCIPCKGDTVETVRDILARCKYEKAEIRTGHDAILTLIEEEAFIGLETYVKGGKDWLEVLCRAWVFFVYGQIAQLRTNQRNSFRSTGEIRIISTREKLYDEGLSLVPQEPIFNTLIASLHKDGILADGGISALPGRFRIAKNKPLQIGLFDVEEFAKDAVNTTKGLARITTDALAQGTKSPYALDAYLIAIWEHLRALDRGEISWHGERITLHWDNLKKHLPNLSSRTLDDIRASLVDVYRFASALRITFEADDGSRIISPILDIGDIRTTGKDRPLLEAASIGIGETMGHMFFGGSLTNNKPSYSLTDVKAVIETPFDGGVGKSAWDRRRYQLAKLAIDARTAVALGKSGDGVIRISETELFNETELGTEESKDRSDKYKRKKVTERIVAALKDAGAVSAISYSDGKGIEAEPSDRMKNAHKELKEATAALSKEKAEKGKARASRRKE